VPPFGPQDTDHRARERKLLQRVTLVGDACGEAFPAAS
jgi:hypothetical protein